MVGIGPKGGGEIRVSIVIPCFNRERLVGEAIESALAQGWPLELIVVDDGSTDGSWNVIESFGSSIRSFRIPNHGVSGARNFGIGKARGDYVRFLDSDDLIPSEAVAAQFAAAEALPRRSIAFGDAAEIASDGTRLRTPGYGFPACPPGEALPLAALLRDTMPPVLPLFPLDALHACGGFDPRFSVGEDKELAVRLSRTGYSFVRVPVTVYEVRHHEGDRLTRDLGATGYRELLALHRHLRDLLQLSPGLDRAENLALARAVWVMGRDASREKLRDEAGDLFALAQALAGKEAREGSAPLRALYAVAAPYTAERILEFCKSALGTAGTTGSRGEKVSSQSAVARGELR